jgi:hypothetical protein
MKIRTALWVLAVAAVASWALPGARSSSTEVAHEFLMNSMPTAMNGHVQPVQLAVLFQSVGH